MDFATKLDKAQKDTQPIRVISSRSQINFFFQLDPRHINRFSIRSFYYFKLTKWLSNHFKIMWFLFAPLKTLEFAEILHVYIIEHTMWRNVMMLGLISLISRARARARAREENKIRVVFMWLCNSFLH
jgi:hypothetical protein